jgi:hypothetical protein
VSKDLERGSLGLFKVLYRHSLERIVEKKKKQIQVSQLLSHDLNHASLKHERSTPINIPQYMVVQF